MIFFKTLLEFLGDKEYRDLILTTLIVIIIGMVGYHYLEGWSWLDALYFSFITLTTVGFGDFTPVTDAGKIFTILYIVVGIGIILTFINTIYNHFGARRDANKKNKKSPLKNNEGS